MTACLVLLLAAGCATLPQEVRLAQVDPVAGYRVKLALDRDVRKDPDTLLLVAFSGGGTRAAAFSYGVLEELRRTPIVVGGHSARMLDQLDGISSVSGGTFTALGYALYGEQLFEVFEPRFLKRDVQRGLIDDLLNPLNWPSLLLGSFTRSDLAASYYDQILFDGATYADLAAKPGPLVVASATEFTTGSRFTFMQGTFDLICADLSRIRLSEAATASSAVPVAFAPVTLRNWGGTCGIRSPTWIQQMESAGAANSLALRQRVNQLLALEDSANLPWLHLVDGGISDNLGLRSIMDLLDAIQTQKNVRGRLGLGHIRRVAVIVVNSMSSSTPNWGRSRTGPDLFDSILQASSVPIDRYSMDSLVLMQSMIERWKLEGEVRATEARLVEAAKPPLVTEFFPIVLDFDGIADLTEREFFHSLPTSLTLPAETIDRLRAVAGTLLRESPQFRSFLRSIEGAPAP